VTGLDASPTFNKVSADIINRASSRSNIFKVIPEYKYENIAYCKEKLLNGI